MHTSLKYLRKFRSVINKYITQFIAPIILEHLQTKIIVVFLAFFLWFFVVTEDDYTHVFDIPIRIENIKAGKIIENKYPESAKVLFWGKGKQLLGLFIENDIELIINLNNVNKHYHAKLKKENIPQHNISVEPIKVIEPDSIELHLVDLKKKKIPVCLAVTVHPIAGYTVVGDIVLTPDSIIIEGPESEVDKIESISTQEIEFKKIKRSFTKKIFLKPLNAEKIFLSTSRIIMAVDVQKLMEKVISRVSIQVRNVPAGMQGTAIPPNLTLTLQGGVKLLSRITAQDIVAYIDYNRKKKKHEIGHPAIIQTPRGINIQNANPKTFKIVLRRE